MWQKEFIEFLNKDFASKKKRNSRYSIRSYAKSIGLSHGPLSELLSGNADWQLSANRAISILDKLDIKPSKKNRLRVAMNAAPEITAKALAVKDYPILADPTYYPILFHFDLPREFRVPEFIAARLGLSLEKVRSVIDDLIMRGYLTKSADGAVGRPETFLKTTDNVPNIVIERHHEISLKAALLALKELPAEKRDFTSLTFAGSEKKLSKLREEIRKLHEKASALMDGESENDRVYKLSIQLFPPEFF